MRQRRESSTRAPRSAIPLRSNSQKETMFLSLRTNSKAKRKKNSTESGVLKPGPDPLPYTLPVRQFTPSGSRTIRQPLTSEKSRRETWSCGAEELKLGEKKSHQSISVADRLGSAHTDTPQQNTRKRRVHDPRQKQRSESVCMCLRVVFYPHSNLSKMPQLG